VGLTALYLRFAVAAHRPVLAGLVWSMAVMTRTPLFFTGLFFVMEVLVPVKGQRLSDLMAFFKTPKSKLKPLLKFAVGAAPLGLLGAVWNQVRFGSPTEFGHRFFFNNRVNADIDAFGLFHPHYLSRNLDAAFLKLPVLGSNPFSLGYDSWGLSLFITLPLLALCFVPANKTRRVLELAAAFLSLLVASFLFPPLQAPPGEPPVGWRPAPLWLLLAVVLGFVAWTVWEWAKSEHAPRLLLPTVLTLVACMIPGLMYQNTGYAQFGFRFSLDYTPYVLLLIPLGGWHWKKPVPMVLAVLSVLSGFWGAIGFRGYTELVRNWP
jgi:hypothetical protein